MTVIRNQGLPPAAKKAPKKSHFSWLSLGFLFDRINSPHLLRRNHMVSPSAREADAARIPYLPAASKTK
jgi:hypothetical protein